MPTARPITVTMFTANTETSNQAPIATVSAMATRIATTARASGMMDGGDGAEDEQQDHDRDGHADQLAAPQVGLGEVARLEGPRGAARDRHGVAVPAVGIADEVVERPDVGLRVARAAGRGSPAAAWRSRRRRRAPSPSSRMRRASRRHRPPACRRRRRWRSRRRHARARSPRSARRGRRRGARRRRPRRRSCSSWSSRPRPRCRPPHPADGRRPAARPASTPACPGSRRSRSGRRPTPCRRARRRRRPPAR